ncbi:hypothetical protein NUW54_g14512 [Trametes sanguinea]|uniref:Uncharacterized protein n=1 Tax=Trametes sanguinea TaxID=158606 RepID=A0ACC1MCR4_9APHY|nr:hypothetical protein NUW54_g14512 [Trametes sanguinea]
MMMRTWLQRAGAIYPSTRDAIAKQSSKKREEQRRDGGNRRRLPSREAPASRIALPGRLPALFAPDTSQIDTNQRTRYATVAVVPASQRSLTEQLPYTTGVPSASVGQVPPV